MQYRGYASDDVYEIWQKHRIPSKSLQANNEAFLFQAIPVKSPWHPTQLENKAVSEKLDFPGMWVLRQVPNKPLKPAEFKAGARAQLDKLLAEVKTKWGVSFPETVSCWMPTALRPRPQTPPCRLPLPCR